MHRISLNMIAAALTVALISGCSGHADPAKAAAPASATASKPAFQQIADGVIVDVAGAARQVRLQVVSDKIIHVTAIPGGNFDLPKSLMAVKTGGDQAFQRQHRGRPRAAEDGRADRRCGDR